MIVDLLHPASVSYVPRGGRASRHTYLATRTPVEIHTVPDEGFRQVDPLRSMAVPPVLYEHRGLLWAKLTTTPYPGGRRDITPSEWAGWLAGCLPEAGPIRFQLSCSLAMTPLAALDRRALAARAPGRPYGHRGEVVDLDGQRDVLADGREAAARAASRFVAEETLVTGSAVYLRHRPVAADTRHCPAMAEAPFVHDLERLPFSPRSAVLDIGRRRPQGRNADPGLPLFRADLRTLNPFIEDDVDVRLLANWLPGELALLANERARSLTEPAGRELARGIQREAEALARVGDVGGIERADARDVLERVTALAVAEMRPDLDSGGPDLAAFRDPSGNRYTHREWLWVAAIHQLRRVLERNEPQAVPEDEEAMAGLAP